MQYHRSRASKIATDTGNYITVLKTETPASAGVLLCLKTISSLKGITCWSGMFEHIEPSKVGGVLPLECICIHDLALLKEAPEY
jgi:hypothetical protein